MSDAPNVPPLVEESVAAIAELHAAHYREAGALQRTVSGATSAVARPGTLIVITVAIAGWAALNFALPAFGRAAPDPFPFPLRDGRLDACPLSGGHDPDRAAPRRRTRDAARSTDAGARDPLRAEIGQNHCVAGRIPPQRPSPGRPPRRSRGSDGAACQ